MSLHFYLGAHHPDWLWRGDADFPLFVSRRRLQDRRTLRPATRGWALDSGGFTELSIAGEWQVTPGEYVRQVARYDAEIGRLEWAAPMDWMCEPHVLARTGLSVDGHQHRTVDGFAGLCALWPAESDAECPFMPVLQGRTLGDYLRCEGLYESAGVRLADYPVVGLGSVCRRQGTGEVSAIVREFAPRLAIHGFGMKTRGLLQVGHLLTSADSLAWSYEARRCAPLAGHAHKNCANCLPYAAMWRGRLLGALEDAGSRGVQGDLFAAEAA